MAGHAGRALEASVWRAEGTRGWPSLPRIQRTEWEVVGSTELVGTELAAAPEFGECGAGAVVHGRAS